MICRNGSTLDRDSANARRSSINSIWRVVTEAVDGSYGLRAASTLLSRGGPKPHFRTLLARVHIFLTSAGNLTYTGLGGAPYPPCTQVRALPHMFSGNDASRRLSSRA